MQMEETRFIVDGIAVSARLWLPDTFSGTLPAVFSAPGFAGVKEMLIPDYSRDFTAGGVASLAFDYPGFGDSGGVPRQEVAPAMQFRCFQAAFDHLLADRRIDPDRIGVWGTSMSGGHALLMAASDRRIKAVAAIIPFIEMKARTDLKTLGYVVSDIVRRSLGLRALSIPVAGDPGQVAAMNTDGALKWATDMAAGAPNYKNEVTVKSLLNVVRWSTRKGVAGLQTPTLAILADSDRITPPHLVRDALGTAPNVEYVSYPETHFELFMEHGADVRRRTAVWLAKQLGGNPDAIPALSSPGAAGTIPA